VPFGVRVMERKSILTVPNAGRSIRMKTKTKTKLNKTNIKKALCMFPPGSCAGIDWGNVEVRPEDSVLEVYIPLKLTTTGIMEVGNLQAIVDGMERVFGPRAHPSTPGLIQRKSRPCFYMCFDRS
jgi:hypothetical protein